MAQPHEPEDRLAELEDRIRANPDSRLFPQLAEEYRRAGRYDDALSTLRNGLERQPEYVSAHVLLGRCLLESGDVEGAVGELERVTANDPTHPLAHKLLSQAQLAHGRREAASQTLERYALLHSGDPELPELRRAIQGQAQQRQAEEEPVSGEDLFDLTTAPAAPPSGGDLFDLAPDPAAPAPVGDDLLGVWEPEREPASAEGELFGDLLRADDRSRWEAGLAAGDVFGSLDTTASPAVSFEPAPQPFTPELARPEPYSFEAEDAPEPVTAEPVAPAAPAPTMTLGRLYRQQGHDDEARGIFEALLERDPDHAGAREALEEMDTRAEDLAEVTAPDVSPRSEDHRLLTAADLEDPEDRHLGLTDRKVRLLGRYLDRLKQGAEHHVP
jgi:cytochrome c-type biogenesis protein CcmH/NrfG